MISNIKLLNFKSIQEDDVRFAPLTIFTGPNSSGKSNIIESIAIVCQIAKQASNAGLTFPHHLEADGAEYYRYPRPSVEFIVHKGMLEKEIKLEIHLLSTKSKRLIGYSLVYVSDPPRTEQRIFVNRNPMYQVSYTERRRGRLAGSASSTIEHPLMWKGKHTRSAAQFLLRPDSFIPVEEALDKKRPKVDTRLREAVYGLVDELIEELAGVYLLSAPRGTIPIQIVAGPNPTWVGRYGQDLIYMLSRIYGQRKFADVQRKISHWAEKFGIGSIAAGLRKGTLLGADFEDHSFNTTFDMKLASYGSRQLLTILAQIFLCGSGETLLIEEPEISLHPESQVLIQELFAEAVSEGKQIICTTHSPLFLLSLSRVVETKTLSKSDVAVYHVEKTADGTKTKLLELSDKGFVKGWIPSYMGVENKLFTEWVEGLD